MSRCCPLRGFSIAPVMINQVYIGIACVLWHIWCNANLKLGILSDHHNSIIPLHFSSFKNTIMFPNVWGFKQTGGDYKVAMIQCTIFAVCVVIVHGFISSPMMGHSYLDILSRSWTKMQIGYWPLWISSFSSLRARKTRSCQPACQGHSCSFALAKGK